jgi:arylsulfatase A-like enzyme
MPKPNILLLMTDQQRYDSLGCYGVDFAHTPNLDRLSQQGTLFENCYVNNPICTPSRASMLTGKHLPEHGVYRLYDNLPEDEVLFTRRLQECGYATALFGKLHVSSIHTEARRRHPNDGFDIYEPCLEGCLKMDAPYQAYARWLEEHHPAFYEELKQKGRRLIHPPREVHMTHWAAERTIDFLQSREKGSLQPFFCMMSVFEPHNPYEHYPREMGELVDPRQIPEPIPPNDLTTDEPEDIRRERHHSYLGDFDRLGQDDLRKMRHGYHASVAYTDLEFGRVLDVLEETGLAENTLVIFTSDHGDMLGDHGLLVKGAFFYDPNVRVPLLMRWPNGLAGDFRIPALVQPHDLAATVLAAAGLPWEEIRGVMPDSCDLLPLARGEVERVHEEVVCCYRNSGITTGQAYWDPPINATMIRDERYKLNVWHQSKQPGEEAQGELFDMKEDPLERENLYSNPGLQQVRLGLTERLLDWVARRECVSGSRGGESRQ